MAFADPQTVTINAVAKSMPRISQSGKQSQYLKTDGTYGLKISHQETKNRIRSVARVDHTAVVADAVTGLNRKVVNGYYFVIDRELNGIDQTTCGQDVAGVLAFLAAAGVSDKLFGQES
jgi:hypothetical protein